MTKSNAETATAVKNAKRRKVLREEDMLREGELTTAQEQRKIEQDLRKIAREEQCPRAATIIQQGMARGLNGRNAPGCAASYRTAHEKSKASNKTDKRQALAHREAERKAERKARAAPKPDDNRKITILDKKYSFGREGTARNKAWQACLKSKTVAEYAAKGGALKYLPRWVAAKAIKLG